MYRPEKSKETDEPEAKKILPRINGAGTPKRLRDEDSLMGAQQSRGKRQKIHQQLKFDKDMKFWENSQNRNDSKANVKIKIITKLIWTLWRVNC